MGFWLKLVDQLVDEQFGASFEEHGLTRRQWQMMNLLTNGPATGPELSDQLRPFFPPVETGSSAELIDELVDSGWVAVREGEYSLTDLGSRSLQNLRGAVERIREQLTEEVSEEEYTALVSVLKRMAGNLGWRETPERPAQDTPGM